MKAMRFVLGAALLLAAGWAQAACYLTVGALGFGTYQAAQPAALDATFNVTYRCDFSSLFPTFSFSAGRSGNPSARAMSNGTDSLQYQLYSDSARTQVLTTGTAFGWPTGYTVTYYARIAGNQDVSPGPYSDTITVTVTP